MRRYTLALLLLAIPGVAACGAGSSSGPQTAPAKLVHVRGSAVPSIVLSPLGAQRIGIRTAPVMAGSARGSVAIPFAALVYEADGTPIVYTNPGRDTFVRVRVQVMSISGGRVYVTGGPAPGTRVVVVGAEELLGVQNGVGAEM